MTTFLRNLRLAVRGFRKSPGRATSVDPATVPRTE
jgi:hypothetical protein